MTSFREESLLDLGCGIIDARHADGLVRQSLEERGFRRFLDHIYIPVSLEELSRDQVLILNRYRERFIEVDAQFLHWQKIRLIFAEVLQKQCVHSLLEIGCGKFPIKRFAKIDYLGVDFDLEAVQWGRANNLNIIGHDELKNIDTKYDAAIAIYAFHFHVSDNILANISHLLKQNAFILYNVVSDGARTSLAVAERFSKLGPSAI